MKNKKKIFLAFAFALTLAALFFGAREKDQVAAGDTVPNVLTAAAQNGTLKNNWPISGFVGAADETGVSSKITGRLANVFVKEGDQVTKGQIIARLDAPEITDQKNGAAASIIDLEKTLQKTADFYSSQVKEAKKQLDSVKKNHDADPSSVNKKDVEAAEKAVTSAKAAEKLQRQIIQNQITAAQTSLGVSGVLAEEENIRAPFSGRVTRRAFDIGTLVSAGTPLFYLSDTKTLELQTTVPQSVGREIKPGDPTNFMTKTNQAVTGQIFSVAPAGVANGWQSPVRVRFSQEASNLLNLGDFLQGQIQLPSQKNLTGIIIPKAGLLQDYDDTFVFVVNCGQVEKRKVTVEKISDQEALISQCLAPGEKVVTQGNSNLINGDKVNTL